MTLSFRKVGDLITISKGKKHQLVELMEAHSLHRYIQIDDLRPNANIKYTDAIKGTFVSIDDCIIAWDGANAGTIGFGLSGLIGSTLARLKIKDTNEIHPPYFGLFLQSKFFDIRRNCTGATIPHVSKAYLESISIPIPPLPEQKRIAAILDKADTIRRKRQLTIKKSGDFLRSVFLDMFGDPVTNPKGWDKKCLFELGAIVTGNTPSRKKPEYYGHSIEWIKSDNINTHGHFLTKADEYLSEEGKQIGRIATSGSILVTCIAGTPECIGNVAMANRTVTFNQQINALIPNSDVDNYFLYAQFLFGKKLVQMASTKSMKGMVSKSRFSAIEFIVPPIDVQRRFGEIFTKVNSTVEKLKTQEEVIN